MTVNMQLETARAASIYWYTNVYHASLEKAYFFQTHLQLLTINPRNHKPENLFTSWKYMLPKLKFIVPEEHRPAE